MKPSIPALAAQYSDQPAYPFCAAPEEMLTTIFRHGAGWNLAMISVKPRMDEVKFVLRLASKAGLSFFEDGPIGSSVPALFMTTSSLKDSLSIAVISFAMRRRLYSGNERST